MIDILAIAADDLEALVNASTFASELLYKIHVQIAILSCFTLPRIVIAMDMLSASINYNHSVS